MEGISISVARKSLDLETVELASIPLPRVEGQGGRITRHWSASKRAQDFCRGMSEHDRARPCMSVHARA
jgi:hypothetical protein